MSMADHLVPLMVRSFLRELDDLDDVQRRAVLASLAALFVRETEEDDPAPAREPATQPANLFLVGLLDGTVSIPGLSPRRLARDEALNLAAWILKHADEPVAFEQATIETKHGPAVLSLEFVELFASVTEGT